MVRLAARTGRQGGREAERQGGRQTKRQIDSRNIDRHDH